MKLEQRLSPLFRTIVGSVNALSRVKHQTITWTNADIICQLYRQEQTTMTF